MFIYAPFVHHHYSHSKYDDSKLIKKIDELEDMISQYTGLNPKAQKQSV